MGDSEWNGLAGANGQLENRKEAGVAGAPSIGGEWGSRGRSQVVRLPRAVCTFLQEGKTL